MSTDGATTLIVADQAGRRRDTGSSRWRALGSKQRPGRRMVASAAEVRKARDLVWLEMRRAGFSVAEIAARSAVDRRTVYRRLQALEARNHGGRLGSDP